jgi:hypothetical protein
VSDNRKEDAEKRISAILADLEKQTGCHVVTVDVVDVNVTAMGDDREQWMRRFRIDLQRPPGTRWSL